MEAIDAGGRIAVYDPNDSVDIDSYSSETKFYNFEPFKSLLMIFICGRAIDYVSITSNYTWRIVLLVCDWALMLSVKALAQKLKILFNRKA